MYYQQEDYLAYFIAAWKKITQNEEVLSIVKGYEISFVKGVSHIDFSTQ